MNGPPPDGTIIHLAGLDVIVGSVLRQRCAWCGASLVDVDFTRIQIAGDGSGGPAVWEPGSLVAVDGNVAWVEDHEDGDRLPDRCCALIDDEVTR